MVLSKKTAIKYFDNTDVIGKVLRVDFPRWGIGSIDFEITGVSENVPDNSHFHYNLLISLVTFPDFINNPGWQAA